MLDTSTRAVLLTTAMTHGEASGLAATRLPPKREWDGKVTHLLKIQSLSREADRAKLAIDGPEGFATLASPVSLRLDCALVYAALRVCEYHNVQVHCNGGLLVLTPLLPPDSWQSHSYLISQRGNGPLTITVPEFGVSLPFDRIGADAQERVRRVLRFTERHQGRPLTQAMRSRVSELLSSL